MESVLRSDALRTGAGGVELRLALPWIRSMPVSCVRALDLTIDGDPVEGLSVLLGGRRVDPSGLTGERSWWFLQDRLVLAADRPVRPGVHAVAVAFQLLVPYLRTGPDAPLVLPFRAEADLLLDAAPLPSVSRDVA
ncbi:hypothetical protein [Naasia aerilata]|uniref:Sporulation and cell division protein SsgA n=1 Tax=Naasia aerilata TaxID=1162966 RepID=A0ABN6XHZ9_9MICO|nr:hypothetical protein [Naasia aerilata]BDZ44450.1 hypothetical protein GCM10025866_03590 [Naasia aerilata]